MQVVIHAGAHVTDEDRLISCLLKNQDQLSGIGTHAPSPKSYRKQLRDYFNEGGGPSEADDIKQQLLKGAESPSAVERLVISNHAFFGTPRMAVGSGIFYPKAQERLDILSQVFAGDKLELFLAVRNPATLLPALFAKTQYEQITDFLNGVEPSDFRWSEMIKRLRAQFPEMAITVWCNEDTHLIWAQVVREMAGLDPTATFEGEHALVESLMTPLGFKRFNEYLEGRPGMTETQKRRVIMAFLDKFVKQDEIEEELDVPGWTDDLVEKLTEMYDEDSFALSRISGVNFLAP